nr:hypothetical protein [Tanacetum cinerariifolium]
MTKITITFKTDDVERISAEEELGQKQKVEEEIAQQEDVVAKQAKKESSKKSGGRLKIKTSKARKDKEKRQKKQDDLEKLTLMEYVDVIPDFEEVIKVIPLAVKSPIVNWKSYRKRDVGYYEIHRADGSYKTYIFLTEMLNDFDREDLIVLYILFNKKKKYAKLLAAEKIQADCDMKATNIILQEQMDGEEMINSIQNSDHPLLVVAQVSLVGTAPNAIPTLKDPKFWTAEEKKTQKIDRLARSLLIQGLSNDIYSLIDSNETAKDLWDALERKMCGSKYGEQDRKAAILYDYETFKATDGEQLLDTYLRYLQVINDLKKCGYKKDNCDVNDALGYKKKAVVVTSDPLALVAKKTNDLKKIIALLAKAFNRKKYYAKPTNNNLRTSLASSSANKKPEYVKLVEKKEDTKKAKVKDYNYYKTKILLAKKDSDEQVLLAEDQAWMESSSDSDQEINANMVFMAKIEKVLSDSDESSLSAKKTIAEVAYYTSESESKYEYETPEYYDNSTNYGLFVNDNDDQEVFHDAIESASENFLENHIDS